MHRPATARLAAWASAVVFALGVASCSTDDGGRPLSTLTDPPSRTTAPSTASTTKSTRAASTAPAPDTTTALPTTAPAPQTETALTPSNSSAPTPPEVLEAVRVTGEREKQLVYEYEPAAADLDSRIAEVAEVGSQYESGVRLTLSQLQAADARFSPSQPSSNRLMIEASWYDGGAEATVQICELIDDRVVSETDPTVVVDEFWDGRLHVTRSTIVMHRSDDGEWRRAVLLSVDGFEGLDTCPPES